MRRDRAGRFAPDSRTEPSVGVLTTQTDADVALVCGVEDLDEYIGHADVNVRADAASNPNLSDEQGLRLIADEEWVVPFEVSQRPDANRWHDELSEHGDMVVRAIYRASTNQAVDDQGRVLIGRINPSYAA